MLVQFVIIYFWRVNKMKGKFTFALYLIIIALVSLNAYSAAKKYYIVFTNFEDPNLSIQTDHGLVPVGDYCYYEPSLDHVLTRDYVTKASFNATTASQILDYDVAIFPMWVTSLNASVDGIRVWDKIKEMLDNGKSVVVIGDKVVSQSMGSGAPSDIKSFFENELGLQYTGATALSNVGSPEGSFVLKAVDNDPVGWGYKKQCNIIYGENGVGPLPPFKWYYEAEFFGIKTGAKAVGFDRVDSIMLKAAPKNLWAGARWEKGTSRFVLWSIGFTTACGVHVNHMRVCIPRAIIWATRDIPRPEAYCELQSNTIDFGIAQIGVPKTQALKIRNFGRLPLTIDKFEFAEFIDDPEIFTISEGNHKVILQPMEDHTIFVDFKPKEKESYEELLDVVANGSNGTQAIGLKGRGGEGVDNVPVIKLNTPLNFGSIPYGLDQIKNIEIKNVGKAGLIIEKLPSFTTESSKAFSFVGNVKVPITVMPGNSHYLPVKFVALDKDGGEHKAEMVFISNSYGKENPDTLRMVATGLPEGEGGGLELSSYILDFEEVAVGSFKDFELELTNKNNTVVSITVMEFQAVNNDYEAMSMYEFLDGTDELPIDLQPGQKHVAKMRFTPYDKVSYQCILKISGTGGVAPTTIPVKGLGGEPGSVYESKIPNFEMSVNPNPVKSNSTLTYTVSGDNSMNLNLNIYDINGNLLDKLLSNTVNPGTYSIDLNAIKYASGKYVIVAEVNGRNTFIPFTVTK